MITLSFDELLNAYFFASADGGADTAALIQRDSGKIYYQSQDGSPEEDAPVDLDDATRYLALPCQNDLDLGQELVFAFVEAQIPADFEQVSAIFRQRGAYRRFKDFLEHRDALDAWYAFEQQATERALREWCAENEIQLLSQNGA